MATKKTNKPHGNRIDISGQRFGRWTVIQCLGPRHNKLIWECRCDCGTSKSVIGGSLRRGLSLSCGCLLIESATSHGKSRSREYTSWEAAKRRCFDPDNHAYASYGGRGIQMCEEWRNDFGAFYAHIGPRLDGHTLDRIDNDKGYEPGNVRWATPATQANNKRNARLVTHEGETLSLQEWSIRTGIHLQTLVGRHFHGKPLFAPVGKHTKRH